MGAISRNNAAIAPSPPPLVLPTPIILTIKYARVESEFLEAVRLVGCLHYFVLIKLLLFLAFISIFAQVTQVLVLHALE